MECHITEVTTHIQQCMRNSRQKIYRPLFMAAVTLLLSSCAARQLHEKDYQRWWCDHNHGEMEYRLNDSTRVDCLTREFAVEVEYAHKWAEAIGQSLYYAKETGRKPGVLVIIRNHSDERFLKRLRSVAKEQGIKIWTIRPKDLD